MLRIICETTLIKRFNDIKINEKKKLVKWFLVMDVGMGCWLIAMDLGQLNGFLGQGLNNIFVIY